MTRSIKINFDVSPFTQMLYFIKHSTSTIMCLSLLAKLQSNEEVELAVRELL
jgi:hypothetical protein